MFTKNKKSLDRQQLEMAQKLKDWKQEKLIIQGEQLIQQEREALMKKAPKKKISFSKILVIFLLINFTVIEIFTGVVILNMFSLAFATGIAPDFSLIGAFITTVIGETLTFLIYCVKSTKENTEGGVQYLSAQHQFALQQEQESQSVG